MTEDRPLPKFKKPPVGEVSVGLRFNAPNFLPIHFGLFYDQIKADFPRVEVLPFLLPEPNAQFDIATENLRSVPQVIFPGIFAGAVNTTRLVFKSEDDLSLIQLQGDRLYYNWRSESEEYPRFSNVRNGFVDAYKRFIAFSEKESFGPITPILSEVLYVNPLPTRSTAADLSAPEAIFRILNSAKNEDWPHPVNDFAFNARYKLTGPNQEFVGWLIANMSSGHGADNIPKISLQMTARGNPLGEGLGGVSAFHDIGHEAIVRCFAAITSDNMHKLWERDYD